MGTAMRPLLSLQLVMGRRKLRRDKRLTTVHTGRGVGEPCLRLLTRELRLAEVVGRALAVEVRFSLVP